MTTKLYYGAKSFDHIVEEAQRAVDTFGGTESTRNLLLGTCCTETDFCTFRDRHPDKLGVSAVQFDAIRFNDVVSRTRKHNRIKFFDEYGVRLADLKLADLACDLAIAFALCRLAYILIPESIPSSVVNQAGYWKKYWNTYHPNAKGTVDSYLQDWQNFMPVFVKIFFLVLLFEDNNIFIFFCY